jgi:hypothetical protein
MANFTLAGRASKLADVQRTWTWELSIPNNPIANMTDEDITIRCRISALPSRAIEPVETFFLGRKQLFPGRVTYSNNLSLTFEETEDQRIGIWLNEWMEKIEGVKTGVGEYLVKNDIAADVYLLMYKMNGELMRRRIRFINAYPISFEDITLDYSTSDSVKYAVTFAFDNWILE